MTERRSPPAPYDNFRAAASAIVQEVHDQMGEGAWVVTRADGDEMIVLCTAGDAPVLGPGERLHSRPELVVPLGLPDGSVYGALCALGSPGEASSGVSAVSPPVERGARLLTTMLAAEWHASALVRQAAAAGERARRAEEEALTDALTVLPNRRAWEQVLAAEERRCRRYGTDASVIAIDLDGLKQVNDTQGHLGGDLLLKLTAITLVHASRESDTVARLGGDEFGILAVQCGGLGLDRVVERLRLALSAQQIAASVGSADRTSCLSMEATWAAADASMYDVKRQHKQPGG